MSLYKPLEIYKASAGSGKTFQLAYHYIRLILCVRDKTRDTECAFGRWRLVAEPRRLHRGILAITFTNKATAEMKARIMNELSHLAAMNPDIPEEKETPYIGMLIKDTGCSRAELKKSAISALTNLLFDFSQFHVSTIDSFFQTVLRTFAHEVDSQGDFDLLIDEKEALEGGLAMMYDELNYSPDIRHRELFERLRELSVNKHESKQDNDRKFFSNPFDATSGEFNDLKAMMGALSGEDFRNRKEEIISYLGEKDAAGRPKIQNFRNWLKKNSDPIPGLKKAAGKPDEFINEYGLADSLKKTVYDWIEGLKEGKIPSGFNLRKDSETIKSLKEFASGGDYNYDKFFKKPGKGELPVPDNTVKSFLRLLVDAEKEVRKAEAESIIYKKLYDETFRFEFISYALEKIRDYKDENNCLFNSDTNELLSLIIGKDDTPFIYERLGVTLRHFLLDEFQDTSRMQWHNLRPLIANGLSENNDSLIIGDVKQSIYRFRNSDSKILHTELSGTDFPAQSIEKGNTPSENTNWRTSGGIVEFNNDLFGKLAAKAGMSTYNNVEQSSPSRLTSEPYYIEFKKIATRQEVEGKMKDPPAADVRKEAIEYVTGHICRMLRAGYHASEIAVLTSTNREASEVIEHLLEVFEASPELKDTKVASEVALYVKNSPAVRILVSILRLLNSEPADSGETTGEGIKNLSRLPLVMARIDLELTAGVDGPEALRKTFGDPAGVKTVLAGLERIRNRNTMSLPSLVDAAIEESLTDELRRENVAYLAAFQDAVSDLCRRGTPTLGAFLKWWDDNCDNLSIQPAAGEDAITVSTIHKAKGLEWPCVLIPFGNIVRHKSSNVKILLDMEPLAGLTTPPPVMYVESTKEFGVEGTPFKDQYDRDIELQTEDKLNNLYVAFTRPKNELIVAFDDDPNGFLAWYGMEDFSSGELTMPKRESAKEDSEIKPEDIEIEYKVNSRKDLLKYTTFLDPEKPGGDVSDDSERDKDSLREEYEKRAMDKGNLCHSVLGMLESAGALDKAIEKAFKASTLDDDAKKEVREVLCNAFGSVDRCYLQRWFDDPSEAFVEQSIYLPDIPDTIRPDRIVLLADGSAEIVDYKFAQHSKTTGKRRRQYHEQLRDYRNALHSMGYPAVRAYLFYLIDAQIEEI